MEQKKTVSQRNQLSNSKPHDSSSKLIFGNAELCSQFLRNYMDIPLLKNVRAEDIEDVTERYIPMFTEERNSDTVKRVKISENSTFYFVSLIEHKTKVDYNVSMQLLRYMVYIWEDYEREMERKKKGVSKTKGFRYPPILPIVYYEGTGTWTAPCNIKDRIFCEDAFEPFTPSFFYKLVQLNSYSVKELVEKKDELSLLMLINRLQDSTEFQKLDLPKDYLKDLSEHSTDELLSIIARVTASMLRHLDVPEDEVTGFTEQVKERKMAELFENFVNNLDMSSMYKIALERSKWKAMKEGEEKGREIGLVKGFAEGEAKGREMGLAEGEAKGREMGLAEGEAKGREMGLAEGEAKGREMGLAEGEAKGRKIGLSEGEESFAKLTRVLLAAGRLEDLEKAASDAEYRNKLYREIGL